MLEIFLGFEVLYVSCHVSLFGIDATRIIVYMFKPFHEFVFTIYLLRFIPIGFYIIAFNASNLICML